jgi:hypothetical protein
VPLALLLTELEKPLLLLEGASDESSDGASKLGTGLIVEDIFPFGGLP